MNESLRHRGPDGGNLKTLGSTGFGHRRLSIIDLTDSGSQPMLTIDARKMLTYNGEVYNFKELRAQQLPDAEFESSSDSEVILKLLEAHGSDAIALLEGMFAFAYYDHEKQELLLARDHFGIKPLYYSLASDHLVFGSELKALRRSRLVSDEFDVGGLNDYFDFMFIPAPRTIYRDAKKLEPGHYLKLDTNTWESSLVRYWTPKYHPLQGRTNLDWVEHADAVLQDSVRDHMVADVEVGTFLSGGVDSSLVTAAAIKCQPSVKAFTVDFANEASSEGRFATDIATQLGLSNHALAQIESASLTLIDRLAYHYDEPFSDSSAFPTYLVCKNAAERLKVCLSGDGGDELFSGYRHHEQSHQLNWTTRIPDCLMSKIFGLSSRVFASNRRWYEWSHRFRLPADRRLLSLTRLPGNAFRVGLLSESYQETPEARGWIIDRHLDQLAGLPPVTRSQIFDMLFYLPGDMLTKVDRASMANSLEVRVPFLSKSVAEFALTIPENQRFFNGTRKFVLREILSKKFGRIHGNRTKQGFSIPLADWLRSMDRTCLLGLTIDSAAVREGILNRDAVRSLLNNFSNANKNGFLEHASSTDLFSIIMFNAWWSKNLAT